MTARVASPGRRRFLVGAAATGGALLVGCAPAGPDRIGSARDFATDGENIALNAWLRIGRDNVVTVAVARAEFGQGVTTSLPMLVAEELDCDWERVRFEFVPPRSVYSNPGAMADSAPFRADDHGPLAEMGRWLWTQMAGTATVVTNGSSSVRDAWEPLRLAGAAARYALVTAAARHFDLPAAQMRVANGRIYAPDGGQITFGELAEAAARVPLPLRLPLKPPGEYRLIGTSPPRLDIPGKTDGTAIFGADIRVSGMRYAAVRMCPVAGGTLASINEDAVSDMPGVLKVVQIGSVMGSQVSIAVVAVDSWTAQRAAAVLPIVWHEGPHATHDSSAYLASLRALVATEGGTVWHATGNLPALDLAGAKTLDAIYTVPMLAHATMELPTCTALYETRQGIAHLRVWVPTQAPQDCLEAAALAADMQPEMVTVQPTLIGGSLGYRSLIDPVVQAAAAAKAMPNVAVQVTWTRRQDLRQDMHRPPMVAHATAWLSGSGDATRWAGWRLRSAGPSVANALQARKLPPWIVSRLPDKSTVEGAFDTPYRVDAIEIAHHKTPTSAPIAAWRGGGHTAQAFFVESFVDEVAHALNRDPLQTRRELLRDSPRHLAVLDAVAAQSAWARKRGAGRAVGLAIHQSYGTVCALVVEVVRRGDGRIAVAEVWCAIDCGRPLHPETIRQLMEGGVLIGLDAALQGRIDIEGGRVKQTGFANYPVLTMTQAPRVHVQIVGSEGEPAGVTDTATPPTAPALCNALFRLTKVRVRDLPIGQQLPMV